MKNTLKNFLVIFTLIVFQGKSCYVLESTLSSSQKDEFLKRHNELRSKVCSGKESGLPECTDSEVMSWDSELEDLAVKYIKTCPKTHQKNAKTPSYDSVGDNLYWSSGSEIQPSDVVNSWYQDVINY